MSDEHAGNTPEPEVLPIEPPQEPDFGGEPAPEPDFGEEPAPEPKPIPTIVGFARTEPLHKPDLIALAAEKERSA